MHTAHIFNTFKKCWEKVENAKSIDSEKAAHHELPHLDLQCLPTSLWILNTKHCFLNFADVNFVVCIFGTSRVQMNIFCKSRFLWLLNYYRFAWEYTPSSILRHQQTVPTVWISWELKISCGKSCDILHLNSDRTGIKEYSSLFL